MNLLRFMTLNVLCFIVEKVYTDSIYGKKHAFKVIFMFRQPMTSMIRPGGRRASKSLKFQTICVSNKEYTKTSCLNKSHLHRNWSHYSVYIIHYCGNNQPSKGSAMVQCTSHFGDLLSKHCTKEGLIYLKYKKDRPEEDANHLGCVIRIERNCET